MTTKKLITKKHTPYTNIRVTDVDGNIEFFKTTKEAAAALDCSPALVCRALRLGKPCVGCKVEEVDDNQPAELF